MAEVRDHRVVVTQKSMRRSCDVYTDSVYRDFGCDRYEDEYVIDSVPPAVGVETSRRDHIWVMYPEARLQLGLSSEPTCQTSWIDDGFRADGVEVLIGDRVEVRDDHNLVRAIFSRLVCGACVADIIALGSIFQVLFLADFLCCET